MDIQQIKYFLALAKELHFWNTSHNLNITQSALSRNIQSLESELEVKLFDRNKRNVKLTPAGAFLKAKWEAELNNINLIHQSARQLHLGESGKKRLAYPDSISASFLPGILNNITSKYPNIQIELVQLVLGDQEEFLKNYKIDLALTRDANSFEDIRNEVVLTDNLALVLPEEHPFNSFVDITTKMFSQQKFILSIMEESSTYNVIVDEMFRSFDVKPEVHIYCESGSTIMALVKKGLGVTILPSSYEHYKTAGLKFIELPYPTNVYLSWRKFEYNPLLANILQLILPGVEHWSVNIL